MLEMSRATGIVGDKKLPTTVADPTEATNARQPPISAAAGGTPEIRQNAITASAPRMML
jgi:hypothetical protein